MELTLDEVFEAYFECRKTKRYSKGALQYEVNYEENLIKLYEALKSRTLRLGRYSCFIVTDPVRREIFAAPFAERIVHHILIRRLNPAFEKYFIRDSYACRKGKGTHAAIRKAEHDIKSASRNGKMEAWVLKLDIQGFFMNIDRSILWHRLEQFIDTNRPPDSVDFEKYLARTIIFNEPIKSCIMRSPKKAWALLPDDKSLFTAKPNCGLPIGNLTSQVFANFYLSPFDHYIKHTLGCHRYVRYVDDCIFISSYKEYLNALIPRVERFLQKELHLKLHPRKIYLQEVHNGVPFLGTFITPFYTLCCRRIKNNFVTSLKKWSDIADDHKLKRKEKYDCLSSVNSYLCTMKHYKTYRFRKKQVERYFKKRLQSSFRIPLDIHKIEIRR